MLALLFIVAPLRRLAEPAACKFSVGCRIPVGGGIPDHSSASARRFLSESLVDGTFLVFGGIALVIMLSQIVEPVLP